MEFHKADDIEKVHINFLKQILGVRRQINNLGVYGGTKLWSTYF